MGHVWLDLARYADTNGYNNDEDRSMWLWREWVIDAFNANQPMDQFLIEQIAGDLLPNATDRQRLATGFNRNHVITTEGGIFPEEYRVEYVADRVHTTATVFLGLSLQCARCHDHKFDPIPTRDYYSMQAVFATTQISERAAAFLPVERTDGFEERRYLDQRQSEYLRMLAELDELLLRNAVQWYQQQGRNADQWLSAVAAARQEGRVQSGQGSATRRKSSDVFSRARKLMGERGFPEDQYPPKLVGFTPQQFGLERVARKGLERLKWEFERYEPFALSVYSGATREFRTVNAPVRPPTDPLSPGEVEETCILT
ncbi:MAG: DUF1549 domain-containing protein, partial [Planctomyces sp.]